MLTVTLAPLPLSLVSVVLEIQACICDRKSLLFDWVVVLSQLGSTQNTMKAQRKLYVAPGSPINGATPAE